MPRRKKVEMQHPREMEADVGELETRPPIRFPRRRVRRNLVAPRRARRKLR